MTDIENVLVDFLGKVRATKMQAGSQILNSAVDTQKNLESLAKRDVPDAREFHETLAALSPNHGRKKKDTPTPAPTTPTP